jgi:hypothetical protein
MVKVWQEDFQFIVDELGAKEGSTIQYNLIRGVFDANADAWG